MTPLAHQIIFVIPIDTFLQSVLSHARLQETVDPKRLAQAWFEFCPAEDHHLVLTGSAIHTYDSDSPLRMQRAVYRLYETLKDTPVWLGYYQLIDRVLGPKHNPWYEQSGLIEVRNEDVLVRYLRTTPLSGRTVKRTARTNPSRSQA